MVNENLKKHIEGKIEVELNRLGEALQKSEEYLTRYKESALIGNEEYKEFNLDRLVEFTRDVKVCHRNLANYEKILNGEAE